jgi:hypothetical protein
MSRLPKGKDALDIINAGLEPDRNYSSVLGAILYNLKYENVEGWNIPNIEQFKGPGVALKCLNIISKGVGTLLS